MRVLWFSIVWQEQRGERTLLNAYSWRRMLPWERRQDMNERSCRIHTVLFRGGAWKSTPIGRASPVDPYAAPTAVETRPKAVKVEATPAPKLRARTTAGPWVAVPDSLGAPLE